MHKGLIYYINRLFKTIVRTFNWNANLSYSLTLTLAQNCEIIPRIQFRDKRGAIYFRADVRKNRVSAPTNSTKNSKKPIGGEHVYVDASLFIRLSVNDRRRCSASPEDTDNTRPTRKDAFITRLPGGGRDSSVWFFVTTASAPVNYVYSSAETLNCTFGAEHAVYLRESHILLVADYMEHLPFFVLMLIP